MSKKKKRPAKVLGRVTSDDDGRNSVRIRNRPSAEGQLSSAERLWPVYPDPPAFKYGKDDPFGYGRDTNVPIPLMCDRCRGKHVGFTCPKGWK